VPRRWPWLACAVALAAVLSPPASRLAAGPVFSHEPVAGLLPGLLPGPLPAPLADPGSARPIMAVGLRLMSAPESAAAGTGVSGGSTISGSSKLGPVTVSSADFLSTELNGFAVDYAAISLKRALRADHALLKQRDDRGASGGGSASLNAAILLQSSDIVARQYPR